LEIHDIHRWDLGYREAAALQERLRDDVVLSGAAGGFRLVAGADVSCERRGDLFWAAVVVMDIDTFTTVECAHHAARVSFPYVPGLLSFREGPILLAAFEKLSVVPDAVIFDGQGIAHPRGLGLAAHLGLVLGIPTVGCAKTRLVGEHGEVGEERGDRTPLSLGGRTVGYVVRTRRRTRPVFVSPGNLISPAGAVDLVLTATGRYRVPEPVRAAHVLVNRLRREGKEVP
jgi:deoxyribonuclease V